MYYIVYVDQFTTTVTAVPTDQLTNRPTDILELTWRNGRAKSYSYSYNFNSSYSYRYRCRYRYKYR